MKTGVTNRPSIGRFNMVSATFEIPEGTQVIYGYPDCNGDEFPHWVLLRETASELSGDDHSATHRFVVIDPTYVDED